MANPKVGSHNDVGNEVLVHIRRLRPDTPPPGNWAAWDYYVMTSLPTNDNPRYATYNINDSQDILSTRFYKYQIGPSDIRIQNGIYPAIYDKLLRYKIQLPKVNMDFATDDPRLPFRKFITINDQTAELNITDEEFLAPVILEGSNVDIKFVVYNKYDDLISEASLLFTAKANFWLTNNKAPDNPTDGNITAILLNEPYATSLIAQVKLENSKDDKITFYHRFITETGKVKYEFIPYRQYQTGVMGTGYIEWTGIPQLAFAYDTLPPGDLLTENVFNELEPINYYISETSPTTPDVSPQTGVIILTDAKNKVQKTQYEMTYPYSYKYITFDSLQVDGFETSQILKADPENMIDQPIPKHNSKEIPHGSGRVQPLRGTELTFNGGPVQMRSVGVQNRMLPLHELNSFRDAQNVLKLHYQGVGCKAAHLAYKVGTAGRASEEVFNPAGTDNSNEIVTANNPAALVFNNSSKFYSRLPECWPWSCRRWTVESTIKYTKNPDNTETPYLVTNYYTQDTNGKKISVGFGDIPKITIQFDAATGDSNTQTIPILNGDPFPTLDATNDNKHGSGSSIVPGNKNDYFNGSYFKTIPIASGKMVGLADAEMQMFGCDVNDTKIELGVEIFPLMHDAQCKLIMKIGFLCYPSGCDTPNMGLGNKKIIYPFNSCRFNESMTVNLAKVAFPSVNIEEKSLDFDETENTIISYLKIKNPAGSSEPYKLNYPQMSIDGKNIIFEATEETIVSYFITPTLDGIGNIDPYGYTGGVTLNLDQRRVIQVPTNTYITIVARKECAYTTDKFIYQSKGEEVFLIAQIEYNKLHDCPEDPLYNIKKYDPYFHPNGVTLNLNDPQTINLAGYDGYVSVVARRKCAYTSDMHIYRRKDNVISEVAISPLNKIHDCPVDFLGRVAIKGNGTQYSEDPNKVVTGADYYIDTNGNQILFNKCDQPKTSEFYPTTSLGNAGGFINWQSSCCDFCANSDGAIVSPAMGPLYNCAILDIEGTPESIPHTRVVGSCESNILTKCKNKLVLGKAKLRNYANIIAEQPPDVWMHASGYMYGNGIIQILGSGFLPVSGYMESGVPKVYVYGRADTMNNAANFFDDGNEVIYP